MSATTKCLWWGQICALTVLCPAFSPLVSRPAQAQDSPQQQAPEEAAKEPAKPPEHGSLPTPASAEAEDPPPIGPVERLPPTAYPEWTTRGIHGGSLWLSGSMHGMPWPYYPKTGIGVSGYAWVDTGYEKVDVGLDTQADPTYLVNQGRAALRISPTYSAGRLYVQGQVELIGNKDQSVPQPAVADLDDLWVRVGMWDRWDVQVGRFEAFEVYHFGMGMDLNTLERQGASGPRNPPDVYGLTSVVYRQSGVGNIALHAYPGRYLRFELLGQFGAATDYPLNTTGVRAAAVFDMGWVKLKYAADVRKQFPVPSTSKESRFQRGNAAALQFVLDPYLELGGNVAYGLIDHYNPQNVTDPNASMGDFDGLGSPTLWSAGGFANLRLFEGMLVGGGLNYNHEADQAEGKFTHLQAFGAVQYLVAKQLFVKIVGSYAKGHIGRGGVDPYDNTMLSGRVRLMYLF